ELVLRIPLVVFLSVPAGLTGEIGRRRAQSCRYWLGILLDRKVLGVAGGADVLRSLIQLLRMTEREIDAVRNQFVEGRLVGDGHGPCAIPFLEDIDVLEAQQRAYGKAHEVVVPADDLRLEILCFQTLLVGVAAIGSGYLQ